jgi:putative DNA primase/helicase
MPYETRQIVAQVRHFIEAHGDARFDDLDPPPKNPFTGVEIERRPVVNRAGWRRGKDESRPWYVPPEVFRREICNGFNPTEAARVLAALGALEKGSDGRPTQIVRLPDMRPQRLYVLTPAIFEG